MIGKKDALGRLLGACGIAGSALRMTDGPRHRLVVLAYHRVLDIGDEHRFLQDPELVSASVADFRRQMEFLRRHCTTLSVADVARTIDSGEPLPRRAVIVTFDDGHVDNHANAFPILRSLDMPACVFVSTDYIGTDRMFWFDRVALLLNCAPDGEWRIGETTFRLGDRASRRSAAGQLLRAMKRASDAQRRSLLDEAETLLAAHVHAGQAPARSALDWAEVAEMADNGIEFGSHTCSHPILTKIDDAQLGRELVDSRRILAGRLGRPVDAIAYPTGKVDAFDERVTTTSRDAGYRLGFSYESGVNDIDALGAGDARFTLRRLAVERYTSFDFFKSLIAFPSLLG